MKPGTIFSYRQAGSTAYSVRTEGGEGAYRYLIGTVMTASGLVSVYSQPDEVGAGARRRKAYSTFTMALAGRAYHLVEHRQYTRRGLVLAAGKFARAVAAGAHHPVRI